MEEPKHPATLAFAVVDSRIAGRSFSEIAEAFKISVEVVEDIIRAEIEYRLRSGYRALDVAFDLHLKPSHVFEVKRELKTKHEIEAVDS